MRVFVFALVSFTLACSSGNKVSPEEAAKIVAPSICRANAKCEPDAFTKLYPSGQDACVSDNVNQAKAVGGDARCDRDYWTKCAIDVESASCADVKAGKLPATCGGSCQ